MFILLKMAPAGGGNTWEKHGAFLYSFHPDVKQLRGKLERATNKISRIKVNV